jgi:hypothetical protein
MAVEAVDTIAVEVVGDMIVVGEEDMGAMIAAAEDMIAAVAAAAMAVDEMIVGEEVTEVEVADVTATVTSVVATKPLQPRCLCAEPELTGRH